METTTAAPHHRIKIDENEALERLRAEEDSRLEWWDREDRVREMADRDWRQ